MTTDEMSREFDLLYNNIMSNAAPGIDEYEKSVFLTKAQEALVTSIYDGTFEDSERMREAINVLVMTQTFDSIKDNKVYSNPISGKSKFFELDENAMFIVFEKLTAKDVWCNTDINVLVKPTRLDEYYRISQNPFRRPRKREALRLNTGNYLEIVSTYSNYEYFVRYIRRPKPIILIDLPYDENDLDNSLTIEDEYKKRGCELDKSIHRAIVEAAVQLAVAAYKGTK